MARAGMALRRSGTHGNAECDDVQRSIELLDRVLSEFDDVENANQVQNIQQMSTSASTPQLQQSAIVNASTPDDESPSLGHQSEDDGYMSMNGRKAKFNLAFKPLTEVHQENPSMRPPDPNDFPPPPEEAQRLIANLLPKVSPAHSAKRNANKAPRTSPITQLGLPTTRIETIPPPQRFQNKEIVVVTNGLPEKHTATQTTLPKTRHQRPYGWENNECHPLPPPGYRFGSLPFQHGVYPLTSPTRVPPRTVPSVLERHREVRRRVSEDNVSCNDPEDLGLRPLSEMADDEHFSDDSLEEMLPPPPLPPAAVNNKRASIAWEVPLDNEEVYMTPGSTKVIGRRRRKSGSQSSTSSIPNRLKEFDDWPEPPPCTTEDEITSPYSDTDDLLLPNELNASNASGTGTYIVRRGRRERKNIPQTMSTSMNSSSSLNSRLSSDLSITRFSADLNSSRMSRELGTPNSRYSIDLGTNSKGELNSPKSRYSLDLNNSSHPMHLELVGSPSRLSAADLSSSRSSTPQSKHEFKKHSTTFDNIKSLIKEGVIEHYNGPHIETTIELNAMVNPIVRVVSLPSLSVEELTPRRELAVTVEEEEDSSNSSSNSDDISPLRKIEQNISELLERRDIELSSIMQDDKCVLKMNGLDESPSNERKKCRHKKDTDSNDIQKSCSHSEILKSEDYYRQLLIDGGNVAQHASKRPSGIQKSESAKEMLISHRERESRHQMPLSTSADFPAVRVEVLQHEFPPLPPSPVQEDDEYSEILQSIVSKSRADTLPTSDSPSVPPHKDQPPTNSLKTRSMDGGYNRGRRNYSSSSNRNERRTLPTNPTELDSKRKYYPRRTSHSPQEEHHLQTSCSLPETPIFARGCDIPRTPHRRAPELPGMSIGGGSQTGPRQSSTMSSLNTMSTGGFSRRGLSTNSGLEHSFSGAELLRIAGGPGRGWYPKHRQRRPASIEHLDRLAPGQNPWDATRKPLTLPPNLTPKFFHKSPRDALRRVTSLLIRKGNSPKDNKKDKEIISPTTIHENANGNGEEKEKKKGFFKSLWKRSRHYSLEQQ